MRDTRPLMNPYAYLLIAIWAFAFLVMLVCRLLGVGRELSGTIALAASFVAMVGILVYGSRPR